MFCKYCGNELSVETNFCAKCGKIHDGVHPDDDGAVVVQPIAYSEDSATWKSDAAEKKACGQSILKLSIWGLALSVTGFLSVPGLVLSGIARSKLNHYRERFGQTEGRATVGNYISLAGFLTGIIALVLLVANLSGSIGAWLSAWLPWF